MDFYFGSNFIENSWGLLQPDPSQSQKIALASLAGLLIPGLAFDLAGGRLGHGQGYYDRFLLGYTGLKVGICFSFQILSQALVLEPHDQKVDFIITENSVHEVSENCTQLKECS
jgi:5-formyltetrahydrofolate cyclo-ligase